MSTSKRQAWVDEFYPIPAGKMRDATWMECIEHCLTKWRGALPSNLEKHDLICPAVDFYSETCALCVKSGYRDDEEGFREADCAVCPLAKARGGVPCFSNRPDDPSPYTDYTEDDKGPGRMIAWLEKAKEYAK